MVCRPLVRQIEERARVQPEPMSTTAGGDHVHNPGGRVWRSLLGVVRRQGTDRGGHHQRPEHAGPGRLLGRLLGAVPQHLPDAARLPRRRRHASARRGRELRVHERVQSHVPLCTAPEHEVLRRGFARRAGRQALDRPDQEDRRTRRSGGPARQSRPGPGAGRPRDRLPPQQARRHLPVRPGHPRHVDRRPRRLPRRRPAQGRQGLRVRAVQPPVLRGGQAGRTRQERPLRRLRPAQERRGHHPLLPGLGPDGQGPQGQEDRRHLPRSRGLGHRRPQGARLPEGH